MPENVLEVKNLIKKYDDFTAVDSISFVVPKGKIIGLLGPNGAGKTTTIHMLLGITTATSGEIKYFGQNFFTNTKESLQRINFASAFNTLQGRISVWENLVVFAYLYSVKNPEGKIKELLKYFEIEDLATQRFWDLSSGQKTRVNLIKALINDPELILMDEPTASLDPDIADKTLSLVENLNKTKQVSILYTSHDMDEVTRICDEVIFLDHGKIVAQDTPIGLTKNIKESQLQITFEGSKAEVENHLSKEAVSFRFVNEFTVVITTPERLIPKLILGLNEQGINILDI